MRTLFLLLATALLSSPAFAAPCARPWLLFDTGNVLIDTSDFAHLRFMPGAREYLRDARRRGYRIGLIVNIPDEWGRGARDKVAALKRFVAENWADARPFDWTQFAFVLVPLKDEERKPAPALFERARARIRGCEALYQGEDPAEIEAARKAGLHAHLVGQEGEPFFLPLDGMKTLSVPTP
jgi:phosphoglycolate phosphatase-like HAD superfamily hydrolase